MQTSWSERVQVLEGSAKCQRWNEGLGELRGERCCSSLDQVVLPSDRLWNTRGRQLTVLSP